MDFTVPVASVYVHNPQVCVPGATNANRKCQRAKVSAFPVFRDRIGSWA